MSEEIVALPSILDVVRERPIDESPSDQSASCPYCAGARLQNKGRATTLVGGPPGTNHVWTDYSCNDCGRPFVRETKSGNVWYTTSRTEGIVLRGIPACFERYQYTCASCGGRVTRRYMRLDGVTKATSLGWRQNDQGSWVKDYRTFFDCNHCGKSTEVREDYWKPHVQ